MVRNPMDELYSPKELARKLKVADITVYKWAERGILPSYKLQGVVRFSAEDVLEFLSRRKRNGIPK